VGHRPTRVDSYLEWIKQYIRDHDVLPVEATCDADALCATDCPAVDPDCPCADDGFCTAACTDLGTDPDCGGCTADGVCRSDCPVLDTDCCATDDVCNAACGMADTDCEPESGGDHGNNPKDGDSGGCTTSGDASVLCALALGLLLLGRRRRS
jgi:uncharacterized protein (TIGR03382 family)